MRAYGDEKAVGAENTMAVHIRRIREKIEINPEGTEQFEGGMGHWIQKIDKIRSMISGLRS